ncbi:MAG: hypothetical protein LBP87_03700 [Planctomycetaceae bacterium]|nr:hypothetical protein [Planctomycetaceae bacterium]
MMNPPRCDGLACVALSGRRKHIILRYLNDYKIDRHLKMCMVESIAISGKIHGELIIHGLCD